MIAALDPFALVKNDLAPFSDSIKVRLVVPSIPCICVHVGA